MKMCWWSPGQRTQGSLQNSQVDKLPGGVMKAWLSEYLMVNAFSCWHILSTAKLFASPNPCTGLTLPMPELTDSPGPPPSQMRK